MSEATAALRLHDHVSLSAEQLEILGQLMDGYLRIVIVGQNGEGTLLVRIGGRGYSIRANGTYCRWLG
jgi:hypothetical protein